MKFFDSKTPLLNSNNNKYGTFPFQIVEYTSNFIEEFNDFLIKDVTKKFSLGLKKRTPQTCKGDLSLIETAEQGEFAHLEYQLEHYPCEHKDPKTSAFKQHLLFAAVKSGNLNTILVVLKKFNNFNDLLKARKILFNNLSQFDQKDKEFFFNHPDIVKYRKVLNFLEIAALSYQYKAMDFDKIDSSEFIKTFIEKMNQIYLKELSKEIEQKSDNLAFVEQKKLESNILSHLENELFSTQSANNPYQIVSLIHKIAAPFLKRIEFNNMFNSLNFYIRACDSYEILQLEKNEYKASTSVSMTQK